MKLARLVAPRLGLRIYLVSVAAVLAALLGLLVVLRLVRDPRREPGMRFAAYPARQVAVRWPDAAAVAEELQHIRAEADQRATVYRWDGTEVASAGERLPPLAPEERAALGERGRLARRCGGDERPCALAFRLGPARAPEAYLLLGPPGPPPPPWGVVVPLALLLVGLAAAAVLLGRGIVRPLRKLTGTALALGAGDLEARTGIARGDELGDVARAFDEMAARIVNLLRSQTELIANVAHELRTPLARIRVALDLAADGDAEVARSSLAEIAEDLGELERLVDDVLTSSRMDLAGGATGVPALHLAPIDVGQVVRGAVERLGHRHPGRAVEVDLPDALPAVNGDAVLLRRALDNLLDNARKYSLASTPIRVRGRAQPGAVVIEIADQGEGIAPEDLARLFTPFFRADPSRARRTGGVGLGLTLSRRILEAHGGTLLARSQVGVGTTLTMTLPAAGDGAAAGAA